MSHLPKPTNLFIPKCNFLSKAKCAINVKQENCSKKEVPKGIPRVQNLRAPVSSKIAKEISRSPLVPLNRAALTTKRTAPTTILKRTCPIIPDFKPKVAKVAVTAAKTGRKSLKNIAPIPKKSKPAPYDYKARFGLLQEKHTTLQEKYNFSDEKNKELEAKIIRLEDILYSSKSENTELRKDLKELKYMRPIIEDLSKQISREREEHQKEISELKKELDEHKLLIEEYENRIKRYDLDNNNNIRNNNYLDEASIAIWNKREIMDLSGISRVNDHHFTFGKVFSLQSMHQDIFMELSQIVQKALDGFNVCVFAYGHTRSGETYIMKGHYTEKTLGTLSRAIDLIFNRLEDLKKIGWEYTVYVTFLEFHLNLKNTQDLKIQMVDLTSHRISSGQEMKKYIATLQKNKGVAASENNKRTSRSHSVARIQIKGINEITNERVKSSLNLVQLNG